jgi:hypothetical protein
VGYLEIWLTSFGIKKPAFVNFAKIIMNERAKNTADVMVAALRNALDFTTFGVRSFTHSIFSATLFLRGLVFSMKEEFEGFNIVACGRSRECCPMIPWVALYKGEGRSQGRTHGRGVWYVSAVNYWAR